MDRYGESAIKLAYCFKSIKYAFKVFCLSVFEIYNMLYIPQCICL